MDSLKQSREKTIEACTSAIDSPLRMISAIIISSLLFAGFLLSTDIYWHLDTISQGRFIDAFLNSSASIQMKGSFNYVITIIYSITGGIAINNTLIQLKNKKFRKEGLSILPGFAAAGCASCGVGLASLIGLGGAISTLPFEGVGIKIAGFLLILYGLSSLGNADTCSISSS